MFKSLVLFFWFLISIGICVEPGPEILRTQAAIWPKPQFQKGSPYVKIVQKRNFNIKILEYECQLLCEAVERFKISFSKWFMRRRHPKRAQKGNGNKYLSTIAIRLTNNCSDQEVPSFNVSEKYVLILSNESNTVNIESASVWGVMHGLQSLLQLFYHSKEKNLILINCTEITDYPDFPHRGLLLDTSRHYIPVNVIKQTLEAMAINKMNVFHWHLTDDQSFPYQSEKYPNLSKLGAYTADMIYKKNSIRSILNFAHDRGIRVIPEFDSPGHTRSWGVAYPQLLSNCTVDNTTLFGPLNIADKFTYDFMHEFFNEVSNLFPDTYVHLGGDEVDSKCWYHNWKIYDFIINNNITNPNAFYITKIDKLMKLLNKKSIVWEEVFDKKYNFSKNLSFQIWKPFSDILMEQIIKRGYSVLYSSCWYLDHLKDGGDWKKYYTCSIFNSSLTKSEQQLIYGGEACMWTEVVDESNLISRIWPRASAVAERLWNYKNSTDVIEAANRLEEHYCRLRENGILAQPPNGPGFCEF